jgi:Uma2 family endonuclease
MLIHEKLYTPEEFFEIAALPENEDRRLELDKGVIVEKISSRLNTVTGARIIHFLTNFVIPNDLGLVTGADGGFKLVGGNVRRPDVGFISKDHGVKLVGIAFNLALDLAVEVVSPDEDVFKKANEYIAAGTRIVWAVYAEDKTVFVIRPTEGSELRVQQLGVDDTLNGGDVLPGFKLPVRHMFP